MSAQDDEAQGYALGAVFGIVALVVAGVIGLAVAKGLHRPTPQAEVVQEFTGTTERVYFELGQDSLPAGADETLARVAEALREDSQAVVLISGFHDASGDPAANAELAKRRAQRVQHALESNGVAAAQLRLSKPALTTGGGDAREARRVEVTVVPGS